MGQNLQEQVRLIEALCNETGLSIEELGDRAAVSSETMRKISKGYTPASDMLMQSLRNVAKYELLARGVPMKEPVLKNLRDHGGPYWGAGEEAPIISYASAGNAKAFLDQGHAVERIRTPCKDPNTYVIRLEGESMEPFFRQGDLLVIMPTSQANNGDLVIAKTRDEEVYFKIFHKVGRGGDQIRLSSYNPAYPPLDYAVKDFYFIHPVHSMIRLVRRDTRKP